MNQFNDVANNKKGEIVMHKFAACGHALGCRLLAHSLQGLPPLDMLPDTAFGNASLYAPASNCVSRNPFWISPSGLPLSRIAASGRAPRDVF